MSRWLRGCDYKMIKLVNNVGKFMKQIDENEKAAMELIGEFVVNKMKTYVAVDTGYLQSRCEYKINRNELFIQNDASYAGYQENGTYKMKAHPFFRPAVYNHIGEIRDIAAMAYSKGIK
jgi:HK97 gp10 family phage protein